MNDPNAALNILPERQERQPQLGIVDDLKKLIVVLGDAVLGRQDLLQGLRKVALAKHPAPL
jgi:hypothetical protein